MIYYPESPEECHCQYLESKFGSIDYTCRQFCGGYRATRHKIKVMDGPTTLASP
jgi:hypothetical protein